MNTTEKSSEQTPPTQEEIAKRKEETIKEVLVHGRQGLAELLRVKYDVEHAAKKKE